MKFPEVNAGRIKANETARAKFVDVGARLLERVYTNHKAGAALVSRLELATALSELPEDMAARALWAICADNGPPVFN